MMFVVYFVVSESLAIKKEGRAYFTLWGNYGQWVFILLSTSTVVVHLSQATLADQQWLKYLNNRKGFTNFYQVAFLSTIFSTLAASLLFLLTVQVRRGLGGSSAWAGLWALVLLCPPGIGVQAWAGAAESPEALCPVSEAVVLCLALVGHGAAATAGPRSRWRRWAVRRHLGALEPLSPWFQGAAQPRVADWGWWCL